MERDSSAPQFPMAGSLLLLRAREREIVGVRLAWMGTGKGVVAMSDGGRGWGGCLVCGR